MLSPATHNFIKAKSSKKKDSIENRVGTVSQRGKLPTITDTVLSRSPRGKNEATTNSGSPNNEVSNKGSFFRYNGAINNMGAGSTVTHDSTIRNDNTQIQQYKIYIHQLINQAASLSQQKRMANHHESGGMSMNFARYQEIMRAQHSGQVMPDNIHSVLNPGLKMLTTGGAANTESLKQLIN